ncbi:hypothetical protein MAHJHV57_51980 [Mycobacterium avium subsp. hominissuis]
MAPTSEWAATPTKVTPGLAAATDDRLQFTATTLSGAPLNGAPLSVVAVNCRRSSVAAARGASPCYSGWATAKAVAAKSLQTNDKRDMP